MGSFGRGARSSFSVGIIGIARNPSFSGIVISISSGNNGSFLLLSGLLPPLPFPPPLVLFLWLLVLPLLTVLTIGRPEGVSWFDIFCPVFFFLLLFLIFCIRKY